MDIFFIFPIHLFSDITKLTSKKVYLIEDPRYFTDFKYHKLKLAYHRASMKNYYNYLKTHKIDVTYIEFKDATSEFYKKQNIKIPKKSNNEISTYDTNDHILNAKLQKLIPSINIIPTLNFLVDETSVRENINEFLVNSKKTKKSEKMNRYNHVGFYKWQRRRLNILMDADGSPRGGKWSFDEDNRKKLPKNIEIPKIPSLKLSTSVNNIVKEAKEYINFAFPDNYGSLDNFIYPIDHDSAKKWLTDFCKSKFAKFGEYEDAVIEDSNKPFLFHSVISPMMNIGLLTDTEVLKIVKQYEAHVPIEAFEGFIRQVIGWRNYMYTIYLLEPDIAKMNFFGHNRSLNKDIMWTGTTMLPPVDNIIHKIRDYGYAHHIERLMYLGNYMLLCQIRPSDVYDIFMEWTIDAYDWVMMANVYSMSQYADGGMIMTKPYFSSSNYILKMSDYTKSKKNEDPKATKSENLTIIWDALYYNFINTHEEYLAKNYGTVRQVAHWRKKTKEEKSKLIKTANEYLAKIK